MGAKNSKREAPYSSTPPRGSPSAKVSRSLSLPTKVFSRRLSQDYGWSIRGKPLLEDVDGIDPTLEYERLVEFEKLHGKENTGFCGATKQDIIRSCISSPYRGSSREKIIYEEGEQDDFVGPRNLQQTTVGSLKASPAFSRVGRSRLSSQSASCLDEFLDEAEGCEVVDPEVVVDLVVVADGLSVGEESGKPVFEVIEDTSVEFQEDSLDPHRNSDSNHHKPPRVTEPVGQSLNIESLSVDSRDKVNSFSEPNSGLPCNGNGSDVCEGELLLGGNFCTTGDGSRDEATGPRCFGTAESRRKVTSDIVLREALQVQEYAEKPGTWKRLNRTTCDKKNSESDHRSREGEGNMTGKGKVNLSFNSSGKRQPGSRRNSFADNRDCDWDSSPGKRMKDGVGGGDATPSDLQPDAFAWGWMSQTDAFLGYDAAGFLGKGPAGGQELSGDYVRRSPKKTSRGTALARKVRGLRASPKPVSSLESCLRAQVADPPISNRVKAVSRPLNFSSSLAEEAKVEDASMMDNSTAAPLTVCNAVVESVTKRRLSALPKLPNLSKFLREYAAKLAMSNKAESSTDSGISPTRIQANDPATSSADDGNSSAGASFESLLFSFGVGLGVLFGSGPHKIEAQRLRQLLEETQANLESLKLELAKRESPSRTSLFDSTTGKFSRSQYVKRSHCESEQQEQMAELEAELEAELDQLTGGDSATMASQYSALDELDLDASVVYGDLAPTGLPAGVEEDTDEDLSPSGRPAPVNNYAVSPRELTRLLRKLQTARQEELITELEEDLETALSKLQIREKELEVWKDRVRRLTDGSCAIASGDEPLTSDSPTGGLTLVDRNSSIRVEGSKASAAPRSGNSRGDQELSNISMLGNGLPAGSTVSEEDSAGPGSYPRPGPASQGEVKSRLHTESAEQDFKEVGRKSSDISELLADDDASNEFMQLMIRFEEEGSSQANASAKDCKPILDNAQIITQLIDSVHGLELYGDRAESVEMGSATPSHGLFSSSVSISDTWDRPLESATPEGASRGTSFPRAKLVVPHPSRRTSWNSDLGNPVLIRKLDNEKSSSYDADQCTDLVRYSEAMESSKSVSDMSEVEPADYRITDVPYFMKDVDSTMRPVSEIGAGVSRAGLTTPVEKVQQELFKTPPSASMKWPGDLSPTVLEKIARWEGLMEGETPGPATGSDWECQSRASESEQQGAPDAEYDDVNVFSEENLVLEAEEMLGRMLIERIVEKSRLGSDSLVKKAQSALATLERDDGAEADVYHVEDTYMNDRTDSEADFSDDNREKQETGLLDAAVREEYEFFRRLEIMSKDRRAIKEKGPKEAGNHGRVDFDAIPELNLGSNAQLSPGRHFGSTVALSKAAEKQPDKEKLVKQVAEPNLRGRDEWLPRGVGRQDASRGSGHREDEVRSRRRL